MANLNKKVLIIGTGSIGKRHYRIFNDILLCETYIKSSNLDRENELKEKGYKIHKEDINYDIGIIATTSDKHLINLCEYFELARIWLVEKPIISIYNFKSNLIIDNKKKEKVFVGYNKRFEKGISKLRNFIKNKDIISAKFTCLSNLENWRSQPTLDSISLDRTRGGGVLNELSHEIDLAALLMGSIENIKGQVFQKKFTTVKVEDSASLIIEHRSGKKSAVEISFASSFEERKIDIKTTREEILYDHITGFLSIKSKDNYDYNLIEKTKEERDESFKRQAEALLYNDHKDLCTLKEGMDLVKNIYELRW
tara:strand:+ start:207 stop:1136 length:930 start_codon:yes stop_codon:yes gene_type:complete